MLGNASMTQDNGTSAQRTKLTPALIALALLASGCTGIFDKDDVPSRDPQSASSAIRGNLDGVVSEGGEVLLSGWACARGHAEAIDVHIYVDGPYGSGTIVKGTRTSRASEDAIHAICQTPGHIAHRFLVPLTSVAAERPGAPLYVYGINPSGPHALLSGSGSVRLPAAPQKPREYRVGAYYFGMFSPAAFSGGTSAFGDIASYYGAGRAKDWWVGVRDLYQNNLPSPLASAYPVAASWWAQDWSHMRPVIGYYDQSKTSTVLKHIRQAKSNGLRFFNFYWYWDVDNARELYNDGLDSFLSASQREPFEFMIGLCAHGWHLTIPPQHFSKVVDRLISKYLSRPNYMRTKDGRLLVQLTDTIGIRRWQPGQPKQPPAQPELSTLRQFIELLRKETRRRLGRELVLTMRMDGTAYSRLVDDQQDIDAASCLVPIVADTHGGIVDRLIGWMTQAAKGKPVMPCLPQGFDERPRLGVIKSADAITYLKQNSLQSFRRGLQTIKAWMDQRPNDELAQMLTIYAWNEWHEGGVIEPNTRDKAAHLNSIAEIFGLPTTDDPCRRSGLCSGN